MYDTLSPLLEWLNAHPNLSGLAIFLISAAESVAIIGTIVPGTVMMTAIGALAGAGVIPLWSTIIWAILGAVVGDGISYWMGFYFKGRLHQIWPFRSYPGLLESGESFFHKHGGKSVFIGRFVGPVRAIVPLIAGSLGMKPARFTVANIISAIGWAPAYMFPGILLGAASLELPPDIAVHFILMLLLAVLFVALCFWVAYKILIGIGHQIDQFLNWIWRSVNASRNFTLTATALKHYNTKKTHGQLTLAFYLIVSVFIFCELALQVKAYGANHIVINEMLFHLFRSIRTPEGDQVMLGLTLLGDKLVLLPVIGILFVWLAYQKNWRTAWHVLALGVITAGSIFAIKHLVGSIRPWGVLKNTETFSFPSGHTTLATTFYFALALLLVRAGNIKSTKTLYTLTAILVSAIGVSRLYLGAHWFTDVLGGWLLSTAIILLISISYNRKSEKPIYYRGMIVVVMLSLAATYCFSYTTRIQQLTANSAKIDWPYYNITEKAWWAQKDNHIPLVRISRIGMPAEVFSLQWLAPINEIKALLLKNGWEESPERDWISVLHRVADIQSTEHVPLLTALYLDKHPVLVMIKRPNGDKNLVVLRLWDSNLTIGENKEKLWVGSVTVVPRTYSWLFPRKKPSGLFVLPLLFNDKPKNVDIKMAPVPLTNLIKKRHLENQNIILLRSS